MKKKSTSRNKAKVRARVKAVATKRETVSAKRKKQTASKEKRQIIVITGVPGTGKTSIARLLAKRHRWSLLSVNDIVNERELFTHIDPQDQARVVRLRQLEETMLSLVAAEKKTVVVEGHLACEFNIPRAKVFVCRTNPLKLKERLRQRKYPEEKVKQNVLSETIDYCSIVAEKNYREAWDIDTTGKTTAQSVAEIDSYLSNKKKKKQKIDWSNLLLEDGMGEKFLR